MAAVFNYKAPAELYFSRSVGPKGPMSYRRFDTAADAIRFVVEDNRRAPLHLVTLEVGEERFNRVAVELLYSDPAYPLDRSPA